MPFFIFSPYYTLLYLFIRKSFLLILISKKLPKIQKIKKSYTLDESMSLNAHIMLLSYIKSKIFS